MARETLLKLLDRARWACSGDNTQPWRFQIVGEDRIIVHGHDTRKDVVYDFDGRASHISHGALLEALRLAATAEGLEATWTCETDEGDWHPKYHVTLRSVPGLQPDPLHAFIEERVIQRRSMRRTPLTASQREALLAVAGSDYTTRLFESQEEKKAIARLMWANAHIRLTCPEAFHVHREILEWGVQFSKDRVPDQALGVDAMTAKLMRWAMVKWERVDFLNRYLGGTLLPRLQLDYLPALNCAAHVLINPNVAPQRLEDWVRLGQVVQRLWLTATQHGLYLQPGMTPVIFRWYTQADRAFSALPHLKEEARVLARRFEEVVQAEPATPFGFFGRVGFSERPQSRSTRLELHELMID
ncbi:MAG: molybdopterin biosynthesis protein MoeY [Firmicutes bacterium]|nr:molybdopterin biosynthesis protein MoeY [Bacillota bacterium]